MEKVERVWTKKLFIKALTDLGRTVTGKKNNVDLDKMLSAALGEGLDANSIQAAKDKLFDELVGKALTTVEKKEESKAEEKKEEPKSTEPPEGACDVWGSCKEEDPACKACPVIALCKEVTKKEESTVVKKGRKAGAGVGKKASKGIDIYGSVKDTQSSQMNATLAAGASLAEIAKASGLDVKRVSRHITFMGAGGRTGKTKIETEERVTKEGDKEVKVKIYKLVLAA